MDKSFLSSRNIPICIENIIKTLYFSRFIKLFIVCKFLGDVTEQIEKYSFHATQNNNQPNNNIIYQRELCSRCRVRTEEPYTYILIYARLEKQKLNTFGSTKQNHFYLCTSVTRYTLWSRE